MQALENEVQELAALHGHVAGIARADVVSD
jgi:hypothetical protein